MGLLQVSQAAPCHLSVPRGHDVNEFSKILKDAIPHLLTCGRLDRTGGRPWKGALPAPPSAQSALAVNSAYPGALARSSRAGPLGRAASRQQSDSRRRSARKQPALCWQQWRVAGRVLLLSWQREVQDQDLADGAGVWQCDALALFATLSSRPSPCLRPWNNARNARPPVLPSGGASSRRGRASSGNSAA